MDDSNDLIQYGQGIFGGVAARGLRWPGTANGFQSLPPMSNEGCGGVAVTLPRAPIRNSELAPEQAVAKM